MPSPLHSLSTDTLQEQLAALTPGALVVIKGHCEVDRIATVATVSPGFITTACPAKWSRRTGWGEGIAGSIIPANPKDVARVQRQLATTLQTYPWTVLTCETLQRFADQLTNIRPGD